MTLASLHSWPTIALPFSDKKWCMQKNVCWKTMLLKIIGMIDRYSFTWRLSTSFYSWMWQLLNRFYKDWSNKKNSQVRQWLVKFCNFSFITRRMNFSFVKKNEGNQRQKLISLVADSFIENPSFSTWWWNWKWLTITDHKISKIF